MLDGQLSSLRQSFDCY